MADRGPGEVKAIDFRGQPALALSAADGARAIVSLHGAHTVSWVPAGGQERLYLSERSAFDAAQPIRGGVPVIFPQFGAQGVLPRHGFARTAAWRRGAAGLDAQGGAQVVLHLSDSAPTLRIWPHRFEAELSVRVGAERLAIGLAVRNRGAEEFSFTAALHTYLRVADIARARLEGLRGVRYRDCAGGRPDAIDDAEGITLGDEIDRIYFQAPPGLTLREARRRLEVHIEGFPDRVIWNPGAVQCARLGDMPADGYRRMLCVEPAVIETPVRLGAGEAWAGAQTLRCCG